MFFAPRPQFLSRSIRKESSINVLTFKTSPVRGYGRCEQIFTLFFRPHVKSTLGQCTVAPQGDPDALSLHGTSHMHPPPAPRPRDATRRPPEDGYTMIHTRPIRRDPAPKNTAHERYRRRPPWPQACARVASAATAMAWGCMRPLWMPFAAGAHD